MLSPARLLPTIAAAVLLACAAGAQEATAVPGFDPNRHLRVEEVRPGMKGYGLTVFRGVEIEPFAVEVVSVQHGFEPGRAVVWVRCPDERMQVTGPVQGMSGSPIYLWTDGQEHRTGEGGRMLGAFAFGHRLGKDCFVGVQPIEQMLAAASRAKAQDRVAGEGGKSQSDSLSASFALAQQLGLDDQQTWRLRAIAQLAGHQPRPTAAAEVVVPGTAASTMLLPITVGSAGQAALLEPFLSPLSLTAQPAPGPGLLSGQPPGWIDPTAVDLRPGSVFAVPLTFGPMEMAAIGTTTEVLPDGTVLAFGHSFFGMGDTAVPMASGFVHFIQPNISVSFKLGGSLKVAGALVRDEQTAVIGKPGATFPTVPVTVSLRWPDASQGETFEYQITHLPRLVPSLLGTVVSSSLAAHTELPDLNTVTIDGRLRFANGWELPLREVQTGANAGRLMLTLAAPVGPLMQNEFAETPLESAELTIAVERGLRAAQIVGATLHQTTVRPGGKAIAHVKVNRHRGGEELHRVEIDVPADLPDGSYTLTVSGAQGFHEQRMTARPHLARAASAQELFESISQVYRLRDDALYATLRLRPANNLAIGRTELPHLPGSRAILLAAEGSTRTSAYLESVDAVIPTGYVVLGSVTLPVSVSRDATVTKGS